MAIPKHTLDTLYPIAEAQAGYFTTRQAEAAGIHRVRLARCPLRQVRGNRPAAESCR